MKKFPFPPIAFCLTVLLALTSAPPRAWALKPGPGVGTRQIALSADDYTRIQLPFDAISQGKFTNTVPGSIAADAQGQVALVPGIAGQALQTGEGGVVKAACRAFAPELHSFLAEFWLRGGDGSGETLLLDMANEEIPSPWQLRLTSPEQGARLVWSVGAPGTDGRRELVSNHGLNEPDRWYRVSLVFGPAPGGGGTTALRIYLDGYVVAAEPYFGKIGMVPTGNLRVRSPRGGALDELIVSTRARDVFHKGTDHPLAPCNLDFESGAEGWVGVHDDCVIDSSTRHSAQNSLRIETDDAYTREYLSPMFSVTTGMTYRIRFWAKVDRWTTGVSSLSLWCRWYFEPEETCSFGGDLIAHCVEGESPRTFDWKEFVGEVTVPADPSYWRSIRWARLQVKNYHSDVRAWVDDISVERVETTEGE